MTELAGHLVKIETSIDGGTTYFEIDGLNSFSRTFEREELDVTHFKDTSGHKLAIMGALSGSVDLSGDFTIATGNAIDPGIKNIIQRVQDSGTIAVQTTLDGVTLQESRNAVVTDFSFTASFDGKVEWSATITLNEVWS